MIGTIIKSYISIFLTLLMPMLILFIIGSTVYYISTHFEFSQAVKLGTVAGALIGTIFSLFAAFIILLIRAIRLYKVNTKQTMSSYKPNTTPVTLDPTLYEKKTRTIQQGITSSNPDMSEEKTMLLMDKNLTYEATLIAIKEKKLGTIIEAVKENGIIVLHNNEEEMQIVISSLTKHTSEITLSSTLNNLNIKNIISLLKEKEHSFMQY